MVTVQQFQGEEELNKRHTLEKRINSFLKRLGMTLRDEQVEKLYHYSLELWRWNKAYNLVSRKLEWDELVDLVLDSITPLSLRGLLRPDMRALDVGAGAGMPGIPLLVCSDGFILELLEPTRKKVTFMRHAIRSLSLSGATVIAERLEDLVRMRDKYVERYDLVMSRAAMPPLVLLRRTLPLIKKGGSALVFVGSGDVPEIKKESSKLAQKGLEIEQIKSLTRLTGKDKSLVLAKKV